MFYSNGGLVQSLLGLAIKLGVEWDNQHGNGFVNTLRKHLNNTTTVYSESCVVELL